jgi:hypothetical protein
MSTGVEDKIAISLDGNAPSEGSLKRRALILGSAGLAVLPMACSPTVRFEPPDRPIEINLNVRIEQEVRIRIERELERVFEENSDIF